MGLTKGRALTRRDLAIALKDRVGLSATESRSLVDQVFAEIADQLAGKESVKIMGFGTFGVRHKHMRVGRNPKTGEPVCIAARAVVSFSASKGLIATVSKRLNDKESVATATRRQKLSERNDPSRSQGHSQTS